MSEIIRFEPKAANNCLGVGGARIGNNLTFDLYLDEGKTAESSCWIAVRWERDSRKRNHRVVCWTSYGQNFEADRRTYVTAVTSVEYRMPCTY